MTNRATAPATCFLSARVSDADEATLAVNLGEAIEPLRMGGVTFYGESARVIRDAQAVLQAAGAGQLEVVERVRLGEHMFPLVGGQVFFPKDYIECAVREAFEKPERAEPERPGSDPGNPFAVVDHQVFINEDEIKSTTFEIKVVRGANGQYHAAGFGVGVEQATGGTTKAPIDADHILSELTKLIGESELSADLGKRVAEIERAGSKQGAENRTLHDRLAALEANQDDQEGRQAAVNSNLQQRITELSVELKSLASK